MVEPKIVADTRLVIGEGTLWHEGEQKLYWLDIPNGSIYRFDPRDGRHECSRAGEVIGDPARLPPLREDFDPWLESR